MSTAIRAIKGLVAVVTGGASGLGEATARRLVQQGASVVICDLPSSKGQEIAEELGNKCAFAPTDVTKEDDVENALRIAKTKFKKLDIAVNCAGIGLVAKTINVKEDQAHSLDDFWNVINVNTVGTFNVIRLAVGLMAENQPDEDGKKGVIINTSRISAFDGQKEQVAYASSTGGIAGMTVPLAQDLECEGIRCCAIAPGLFDTPFLHEKTRRELAKNLQFPKRLGQSDEYAHLVQTIIENPFLNACVMRLDGGLRLGP